MKFQDSLSLTVQKVGIKKHDRRKDERMHEPKKYAHKPFSKLEE